MKNEMGKYITAELEKHEIHYDLTTNNNGLATIILDAKTIELARKISMQVFKEQGRKLSGSVLLKQKTVIH